MKPCEEPGEVLARTLLHDARVIRGDIVPRRWYSRIPSRK